MKLSHRRIPASTPACLAFYFLAVILLAGCTPSHPAAPAPMPTLPITAAKSPSPTPPPLNQTAASAPIQITSSAPDQDSAGEKIRYPLPAGCQARPDSIEFACIDAGSGLRYWLYLPAGTAQKPPLLIYLHGFNHSGSDLDRLQNGGLPLQIEHGRRLPMLVASPQCPSGDNWQNPDMVERLSAFVDALVEQYGADPRRVYLTGFSMGGDGVWALGIAHPEQFAALVPVGSWYVNVSDVCGLKDVPVWDFQGNMDEIVSPQYAKEMVAALERCGGSVKLTLYPAANHEGSSGITYETDALYQWMLEQEKDRDAGTRRHGDAEKESLYLRVSASPCPRVS